MVENSVSTPARHVSLKPGEEVTVELAGLGSAGYRWQEVVDGDAGTVSVTWRRGAVEGLREKAAGVSAAEIATVRAERAGQVTVQFIQIRPWERDIKPLNSQTVMVRVRPASSSDSRA
jgi:predicted secreted protein